MLEKMLLYGGVLSHCKRVGFFLIDFSDENKAQNGNIISENCLLIKKGKFSYQRGPEKRAERENDQKRKRR